MASPSTPVHPARYLAVFLVLLVGVYLLVFLTGDKQARPKLGIDLQGGTRVTLTARTPDGSAPTRDALNQAQQIISARVNGLGVSGSEVIIDGSNLVITVPGNDSSEARNLGQTARLYIRPVIEVYPAAPPQQGQAGQPPAGAAPPAAPALPEGAPPGAPAPAEGAPPAEPATEPGAPAQEPTEQAPPQPRPYPQAPPPSPAPPKPAPKPEKKDLAQRIADQKKWRQSTEGQIQYLALQIQATQCNEDDILAGNDDPNLPLVTCSTDHSQVYLLDKSIISGEQIKNASSGMDNQSGEYVVQVEFKPDAASIWADFTASRTSARRPRSCWIHRSSALPRSRKRSPVATPRSPDSSTPETAKELANVLKYGSLPLSFESSEAETVSATLGLTSLRAGLIAGAIGLALVLLYSLLYYRVLGVLTALSLVASGAMVFAILVLLGRYINYTLDLAGIAGLIIGIGMTADSFVVFFERIKDEIREGRSFRSAVPRGWARARKTIISGNAVTFLAAVVLYVLAVGQVKGFAFTLGLTTILDVVVVFLVTWPLVYLASKSTTLAKPAFNGLGAVQQIARERRASVHATGRG